MQVSDLITMLRSDLLDDATKEPLWDDNALIRAINEAQRQACSRGDYIFHKFTLAIKEGTETYRLDPHITRITRILIDGVEIHRKTRHELDDRTPGWRTREGEETVAVINGRNIHITPKPTADAACIIEAYRMPCKIASASDELQIIPEYQPDLSNYCLYYLLSKRDVDTVDGLSAKSYLDEFDAIFGKVVPANVRIHQLEAEHKLILRPHSYAGKSRHHVDNW
jgi:hypothetical protein